MPSQSKVLVCLFMLVAGCASPHLREPATSAYNNPVWSDYVQSYQGLSIQEPCRPRLWMPPKGQAIIGKVIAVHGYTACPQQYFEWAQTLINKGYVVQMVLMPGHGLMPVKKGVDNIDQMPSHGQTQEYYKFAEMLTKMARADRLPTSLAGISVGGAVALRAAVQDPGAFDKVILFSPYFAASNLFYRNSLPIGGNTPLLSSKTISWGPSCLNEMSRGRGGTCSFRLHQLQSAQKFGKEVVHSLRPIYPKIQIVGVTQDKAASSEFIAKAAKNLGWSLAKNKTVSVCLYTGGANHSLLSRFDSPDENKFWLKGLLRNSTYFITDETFLPTSGDSGEFGIPSCT